jgi:hypothetical protein
MNIKELKSLVAIRRSESLVLLKSRKYHGSYYLSGHMLEVAIKACIVKKINGQTMPDKKFVEKFYTHNLEELLKLAGLFQQLTADCKSNPTFASNWSVVKDWNVDIRYNPVISARLAKDMYSACVSRSHGILPWVRAKW